MKKAFIALFVIVSSPLMSMQKLPEEFRVFFGDRNAETKVTEYFSFSCPHCISLFNEDFVRIKRVLIETDSIFFEFHPVPVDMNTVQAMACFEKLTDSEKREFLYAVFSFVSSDDSDLNEKLMIKAMEILEKPTPELANKEYLMSTAAFHEAFNFLKQEDTVAAIPSVSIDGVLFSEEMPSFSFLETHLKKSKESGHEKDG